MVQTKAQTFELMVSKLELVADRILAVQAKQAMNTALR